jgi:hypothetical protein
MEFIEKIKTLLTRIHGAPKWLSPDPVVSATPALRLIPGIISP